MTASLTQLEQDWSRHRLGARRAAGGRVAIGGFEFQLSASLLRFVDLAEQGDRRPEIAFDGLSDLSVIEGPILCLVQMKTTLDRAAARAVAHEALAIDEFLEQEHADVRERVRFEPCCLRMRTVDPSTLSPLELELDASQALRWEAVRPRLLPPVVRGDPFSELVARLYPLAANAPDLAYELLGDLTRMLASDQPSSEIGLTLFKRLAVARERRIPDRPGALLSVEDFARQPGGSGILLGQRPGLKHLARGWFMERDDIARSIATSVLQALDSEEALEDGIEVHWLTGASGIGKSVLLLQAMEHLVQDGRCLVHRIPHVPPSLRAALAYWRSAAQRPVVVGTDDLYAPAHRGTAVWEEITAQALDADWSGRLVVLTAGPDDYRRSFTELARRDGAFRVRPIPVHGLRSADRERYRAWHAARTGSQTPPTPEPLFVVAALLAEAHRAVAGSVDEFAQRFIERCESLRLREPMLCALAMNRLGFPAPAALFADEAEQLERLIAEDVVQRDDEAGEQLTVFHQQVAIALYKTFDPERITRATHLVKAFAALPRGHETRRGLLSLLHAGPQSSELGLKSRKDVLAALWEPLWERGPAHHRELVAWLFGARAHGVPIADDGRPRRLVEWMFAADTPAIAIAPTWLVLREIAPELREELHERVIAWLRARPADGGWSEVCREALRRVDDRDAVIELARGWLTANPGSAGWVELFAVIHGRKPLPRDVLAAGLAHAPVSVTYGGRDERRLWDAAIEAGVPHKRFLGLLVARLCRSPSRTVVALGVGRLGALATPKDVGVVRWALMQEARAPIVGTLVRAILSADEKGPALVTGARSAGIEWLEHNLEAYDWAPTWIVVFAYSRRKQAAIKQRLLAALERWLAANPASRFWLPVMKVVLEDTPSAAASHLAAWLPANTSRRQWLELWRGVRTEMPDRGSAAAAAWLARFQADSKWFEVFTEIWTDAPGDDVLRAVAIDWLASRPRSRPWMAVFTLVQASGMDQALRSACRPWLLKVRHPGWWWVFREAVGEDPVEPALVDQAMRWLQDNPQSCGVPAVRAALER